jgi:hypothetical protein
MWKAANNMMCTPCQELPASHYIEYLNGTEIPAMEMPEIPADKMVAVTHRCISFAEAADFQMQNKKMIERSSYIGMLGLAEIMESVWPALPQPNPKVPDLQFVTYKGLQLNNDQESTFASRFTVAIVGVNSLESGKWKSGSDVCVLKMLGDNTEVFRTKMDDNIREPQWNEEVEVERTREGESIEFLVYRQKTHFSFLMGRAVLDHKSFQSFGFNGEVELRDCKGMILGTLAVKVKLDGQGDFPEPVSEDNEQSGEDDCPQESSNEIPLSLHGTPGKPVGLAVDVNDGITVYVSEVKEGPFLRYNRRIRNKDLQLRPGDFIKRVNGVEGNSAKILEQLQLSGDMEVVVCRPLEAVIPFKRDNPEQNFGVLVTNQSSIGRAVLLGGVVEGSPLHAWNLANPDDAIVAGDRIVAVNDQRGTASQLMEAISNQKNECRITIAKPPCRKPHSEDKSVLQI